MPLPWLIGAAAVAAVGYLASSNKSTSSSSSSNYDEEKDKADKIKARKREEKKQQKKDDFYEKWEVSYMSNTKDTPRINKLITENKVLENEIDKLNSLLSLK